ncbi:MAG TPA: MFS transporter [Scandinavium sp.]|jgi:FHS family L-fucose permease-like MFS transporter|uniref:MFS transporter n=1 Tax=Scandinavium sp. TaxID=2830653 RepID=UPI002E330A5D|nr:MFS transporter [Scandinavium sp.]HEX4501616.1 MFS transporter [Scandinavium sp.]
MKRNFVLLAMVFFLWGNITAVNSVIILFFYHYFQISWQQAMLVTVLFYIAPFVSCIPCSLLIARYGYRRMLQSALMLSATGCTVLAATLHEGLFIGALIAVFVVAVGVAAMQVVANPYLALLSPPERRVSQLSLASAVNSLGTTLAPACIALLLQAYPAIPELHQEPMSGMWLVLALFSLLLLLGSQVIRLPDVAVPATVAHASSGLWRNPQVVFSVVAIFVYVGVEVSLATNLLKYLTLSAGWSADIAMSLITLYWGGALVGRLMFGLFGRQAHSAAVFKGATLLCALLVAVGMWLNNGVGGGLLLLAGIGNSVMYPIIFSHAISQQPQRANILAGAMVMAGIGGALFPWLQALIIDTLSLRLSFLLPLGMYLSLAMWGVYFLRPRADVSLVTQ